MERLGVFDPASAFIGQGKILLEGLELEEIKFIFPFVFTKQDKDTQKVGVRNLFYPPDSLETIFQIDLQKLLGVELPGGPIDGFYLNRDGKPPYICGHQVKIGYVPCERCGNITKAAKFSCNEMLWVFRVKVPIDSDLKCAPIPIECAQ